MFRLLSIAIVFGLLVSLPADSDARPHLFGTPHFPRLAPRLAARRAERLGTCTPAAQGVLPTVIPQALPVGPEKSPDAKDAKAPAFKSETKFFHQGEQMTPAPAGAYWHKVGCNQYGCWYETRPVPHGTRGSAACDDGCPCGCSVTGVCTCGTKK